ncbi:MmgE/PrpD family protein [Mesorhizobium sp. ANAO-SY3R2]|uniref:MmgE/PrpD family protein n=1 Tax=Mesorhizobium sp. ANAO-SY3R2 TaxID=3166644 RepID=UPI00366D0984
MRVFVEEIFALSKSAVGVSATGRTEIEHAYIDTLAVMCAGWNEPVTQAMRKAFVDVTPIWQARNAIESETAALVWGTAAHALDYDDVHMTSVTHPSAVLIPAIEAAACLHPEAVSRKASAYAVGLALNVGLGQALGFGHYAHGWHATSTIGAVAAGAAIAHLLDLDQAGFSSALAIAAAQAAGLQRNFGTMTKPLQAGLAAQAAVRAGRLALAGVGGAEDVLEGTNGFLAVYGGNPETTLTLDVEAALKGLSKKLFACCYLAHRPVAAALQLHAEGRCSALEGAEIDVLVPPGCLKALTVGIPSTGIEAKFSGQYTVAHALLRGELGLRAFLDSSVCDPAVIELAHRVALRESPGEQAAEIGIDRGEVRITILRNGVAEAFATVTHYPGSPALPITATQLAAKLADCVALGAPDDTTLETRIREMARDFARPREN